MIQPSTYENNYLEKKTKTQVRCIIRNEGSFHGYICGNHVHPSHINNGWHAGVKIDVTDIASFEDLVTTFQTSLQVYTPELGSYPHYYQVITNEK